MWVRRRPSELGAGHVTLAEHHPEPRRGAKRQARSCGVTARLPASCRVQRSRRLKLSGVQRPPDRQHQHHQRGLHCDQHEGVPQQAILACKVQAQKSQASLIRSTGRDHRAPRCCARAHAMRRRAAGATCSQSMQRGWRPSEGHQPGVSIST